MSMCCHRRLPALLCILLLASAVQAGNKPCSGKKGGVSHCVGSKFVCSDGSISASKKTCSASDSDRNRQSFAPKKAAKEQSACQCDSGRMCTGPRGGRYCLTPSGNKSYQRK